ncbi:hypothetical protein LINPERPRIM_LOCUS6044, partial [Linum perenne]
MTGRFAGSVETFGWIEGTSSGIAPPFASGRNHTEGSLPNSNVTFSVEELGKLKLLLQQSSISQQPTHTPTHQVHSTFLNQTSNSNTSMTGASDHVVCHINYFLESKPVDSVFVSLPNGTKVPDLISRQRIGSIQVDKGLYLLDHNFGPHIKTLSITTSTSSSDL